jgi:hypothetical protein
MTSASSSRFSLIIDSVTAISLKGRIIVFSTTLLGVPSESGTLSGL